MRRAPILVFLLLAAIFTPIALLRLIAGDEGYFLMAGKLLLHGKLPYTDFFFPQMPLAAALPALSFRLGGTSWESARVFYALLSALCGAVLFDFLQRKLDRNWALFGTLLFATSDLVVAWYGVAKAYSAAALFLLVAFSLICLIREGRKNLSGSANMKCLFAGVFFTAAVEVRLYVAVLGALFVLQLWHVGRRQAVGVFSLGAFALGLPCLYLLMLSPEHFWFNNLGYHLARSDYSADLSAQRKLLVLAQSFALSGAERFNRFQFPLLLMLSLGSAAVLRSKAPYFAHAALAAALMLFAASFLPTPMYAQYFCLCVPFLVIALSTYLHTIYHAARPRTALSLAGILLVINLAYLPGVLHSYSAEGDGVIGVKQESASDVYNLSHLHAVDRMLDALERTPEHVLSEWPGYLIDRKVLPYPGFENHFGFQAAKRLAPQDRARFLVIAREEVIDKIRELRPKLVLSPLGKRGAIYERELPALGYSKVAEEDGITLYVLGN